MQRVGTSGRTVKTKKAVLENLILFSVLLLLVLFDQIVKIYLKNAHENDGWQQTEIIKNFFYFYYTENEGAAWSFLADKEWGQLFFKILTGVALVVFVVIYIILTKKQIKFYRIPLVMITAGTIGNFIDRLLYNKVVDFIRFIFGNYYFPVFNIADILLTVGAAMVIIALIVDMIKDGLKKDANNNADGV